MAIRDTRVLLQNNPNTNDDAKEAIESRIRLPSIRHNAHIDQYQPRPLRIPVKTAIHNSIKQADHATIRTSPSSSPSSSPKEDNATTSINHINHHRTTFTATATTRNVTQIINSALSASTTAPLASSSMTTEVVEEEEQQAALAVPVVSSACAVLGRVKSVSPHNQHQMLCVREDVGAARLLDSPSTRRATVATTIKVMGAIKERADEAIDDRCSADAAPPNEIATVEVVAATTTTTAVSSPSSSASSVAANTENITSDYSEEDKELHNRNGKDDDADVDKSKQEANGGEEEEKGEAANEEDSTPRITTHHGSPRSVVTFSSSSSSTSSILKKRQRPNRGRLLSSPLLVGTPSTGRRVQGLWSPIVRVQDCPDDLTGENTSSSLNASPASASASASTSATVACSRFAVLQEATLSYIFCYLPLADLLRAGQVARRWRCEIHDRQQVSVPSIPSPNAIHIGYLICFFSLSFFQSIYHHEFCCCCCFLLSCFCFVICGNT